MCKQWAHLKGKPENEYLNDSGVQLVNQYASLKKKKSRMNHELSSEIEQVEEALIKFAKKDNVEVVFGDKNKVRIKEYERYRFPSKHSKRRNELIEFLKKQDKWEKVNQLDTSVLNKILLKNQWNDDVLDMLKEFVELDRNKRLYVSKMRD